MSGMAEVLLMHQRAAGVRDMNDHCMRGYSKPMSATGLAAHQADALTAAGFGAVNETTTEWGVRRDADSAVYSEKYARETVQRQRKRKMKSFLIKRQVGPWELAEP
jgi:hypothetical protein